ncbi:outer membrane beta-barrel protein [Adhaeribacter sp. BT258]|uniref:Outer membrane beta-barrel protein n=1 Tax=Adhaeribacter terrigena TaxID=2793070 RepID=A0ABS1C424_9BACT|nr:outer membrane beta-barrel protein [Adhaeribacter terrigena]MBK0404157.1 outer membrane beta-barrel protein [Adhaeribacter terrigena]
MKKILASLFLAFASFSGFSQEINSENQFKINIGVATPLGKFGETDMKRSGSGFATTGLFLDAGFTKFVNKNFGVGIDIIHISNNIDEDAFLMEARKLDQGINSVSTTSWQSLMSLITLTYRYQIEGSHLHPFIKVSGGLAHSTAPKITYENLYFGQSVRQDANGTSTALGIGAGFQYRFNNLSLGLESNYIYTKPEFKLLTVPFKQTMNTLNSSISVSYIWGRN